MTWWVSHPTKYKHAMEEIPKQRDRGAAIVATSILEEHLLEAIQARLVRNASVEKKVFSGYGPLASFSARIDIGLLLGLYPQEIHTDLHLIRRIRNNFAHSMRPISFASQRDDCKRLAPVPGAFRKMNKWLETALAGQTALKVELQMYRRSTNPRTQFLRGIQQNCMYLSTMIALDGKAHPVPATSSNVGARTSSHR